MSCIISNSFKQNQYGSTNGTLVCTDSKTKETFVIPLEIVKLIIQYARNDFGIKDSVINLVCRSWFHLRSECLYQELYEELVNSTHAGECEMASRAYASYCETVVTFNREKNCIEIKKYSMNPMVAVIKIYKEVNHKYSYLFVKSLSVEFFKNVISYERDRPILYKNLPTEVQKELLNSVVQARSPELQQEKEELEEKIEMKLQLPKGSLSTLSNNDNDGIVANRWGLACHETNRRF